MDKTTGREIIEIEINYADIIRLNNGITDGCLRISFIGGHGDVVGTYKYWREGKADPRVPSVTYSSQLYELAKRIDASLQVVTGFPPPEETGPGFQFAQVRRPPWKGKIGYYISQSIYRRDVIEKVELFNPHIVIVSTDFPQNGWRRLKQGRKLVLTAHNTFWPMGSRPVGMKATLRMKLLKYRSRVLDGAVCTSPECVRQIGIVTSGRIRGRAEHPQIIESYSVEKRQIMRKLLFLGRIERSKGIFMLLDVFVALKHQFPDLVLTFAGSGSCDDELHAAIKAANLPDLRFLGRLDSESVHREIAATDLIVCPTMRAFPEGLALVGLEGAAHGIPTLLSSVVPAVDLLGAACKSFQVDDAVDLKRALTELITDDRAYGDLLKNLEQVRPRLYDPSLSWGSQLARVMLEL